MVRMIRNPHRLAVNLSGQKWSTQLAENLLSCSRTLSRCYFRGFLFAGLGSSLRFVMNDDTVKKTRHSGIYEAKRSKYPRLANRNPHRLAVNLSPQSWSTPPAENLLSCSRTLFRSYLKGFLFAGLGSPLRPTD